MKTGNEIYYFDIGEGRWDGVFGFRITDFKAFLRSDISGQDRFLALLLHAMDVLPGDAVMHGEITGDRREGVARVDVGVFRFGIEVYRLRGHYALGPDGKTVNINILQRFGPPGFPLESFKQASADIDDDGHRALYYMPIFGIPWVGEYKISDDLRKLDARYDSAWGITTERMRRRSMLVPKEPVARARWDALLNVARDLEALNRKWDDCDDPRAVFAYAYSVITRDIAYHMASATFRDPDWVVALGTAFANCYLKAADSHDRGMAPRAWRRVFQTICDERLTALDELFLCVFVHVAHDLPCALVEVGLTDADGRSHIDDFHALNTVFDEALNPLQTRLGLRYNPALIWLDGIGRDYDERLGRRGLSTGRALAWYNAERLAEPGTRDATVTSIERAVEGTIAESLGEAEPSRLALKASRLLVRLFRRRPRSPGPAVSHFGAADTPKLIPPPSPRSPFVGALYQLHSAIGAKHRRGSLEELRTHFQSQLGRLALPNGEMDRLAPLFSTRGARVAADAISDLRDERRFDVAAILGELVDGGELADSLSAVGVDALQHEAIRRFQKCVTAGLDRGWDAIDDQLQLAVRRLDELGVPGSSALVSFEALRTAFDRETGIFTATVPAYFRQPWDRLAWVVEPDRWDDLIESVVSARYLSPPVGGRGVLREEVNIFHPWLTHHPLYLINDLDIRLETTADRRVTHYSLAKSIDGTFDVDEGHLSVQAMGENASLVMFEKRVRVVSNPLLYGMLRFNPDGLGFMLSHWIQEGARTGLRLMHQPAEARA